MTQWYIQVRHQLNSSQTTGTDGKDNILDLQPRTIHDRTQVFLGSTAEIQELHKYTGHKLKEIPSSK